MAQNKYDNKHLGEEALKPQLSTYARLSRPRSLLLAGASILALGLAQSAEARVTSISISSVAPAYG